MDKLGWIVAAILAIGLVGVVGVSQSNQNGRWVLGLTGNGSTLMLDSRTGTLYRKIERQWEKYIELPEDN
jgi:hypothetical protein